MRVVAMGKNEASSRAGPSACFLLHEEAREPTEGGTQWMVHLQ
jgi:hypothetical protein